MKLIPQILDKGLQVFPYPTETTSDDGTATSCPPIGVSVTLPDSVVFLKTPRVACWDVAGITNNISCPVGCTSTEKVPKQ